MIACHSYGMINQLFYTLIMRSGNRNNRYAKKLFELVDKYGSTIVDNLIHHVECHNHRCIQLHQLHRQIQISFHICRIHDIDDSIRFCSENKLAGDDFFCGIRRQRIDAWQIRYTGIIIASDLTVFLINCHTREITDMLVGTCQLIEQCCLTAVLITNQSKTQFPVWIIIRFAVCSAFTKLWMRNGSMPFQICSVVFLMIWFTDRYLFCFIQTQCQFISTQFNLHRISHRCCFL